MIGEVICKRKIKSKPLYFNTWGVKKKLRTFLELSKNSMNTNVQTLILANNEVTISFKDIKNIHLSVYPPFGEVRVAAPLQTNLDSLRAYLSSKIGWIKKERRTNIKNNN